MTYRKYYTSLIKDWIYVNTDDLQKILYKFNQGFYLCYTDDLQKILYKLNQRFDLCSENKYKLTKDLIYVTQMTYRK